MDKCWDCYSKKKLKPKLVAEQLTFLMKTPGVVKTQSEEERVWVIVLIVTVSQGHGLAILMEGSHRKPKSPNTKPYEPTVQPGHALIFDARPEARNPSTGGDVALVRGYDVTGMQDVRYSIIASQKYLHTRHTRSTFHPRALLRL